MFKMRRMNGSIVLLGLTYFLFDFSLSEHQCTQYMDHGSLYDILHNETMVVEPEIIIPIIQDICQGMRFLHSANPEVIHGDLKVRSCRALLVHLSSSMRVCDSISCVLLHGYRLRTF